MSEKRNSERDLIRWIRGNNTGFHDGRLIKGIGDDCAVFKTGQGRLGLLTTDTLIENVHFNLDWHPAELLGRKSASVNLSDIAAMGGAPVTALLTLALPALNDEKLDLEAFMRGFIAALSEHQTCLVGGDTVRSDQLMLSVTIYGEVREGFEIYRSGARIDDLIWVTGHLGNAAAGLDLLRHSRGVDADWCGPLLAAHLDPEPEVVLGKILSESGLVTSMMDLSDGLATDLAHLCSESGVGALLTEEDLPVSAGLLRAGEELSVPHLHWALNGGEDYRLLFTSSPKYGAVLRDLVRQKTGREVYNVGRIMGEMGVRIRRSDQAVSEIGYGGYDHFQENSP